MLKRHYRFGYLVTAIENAYKAINTAEAGTGKATAAQKTALKTALQQLANVTSHKAGDLKFDASIVTDQNLVTYAEKFATATAIGENSLVKAVITDVNAVNHTSEVATGIVSTDAELVAALKNEKHRKNYFEK